MKKYSAGDLDRTVTIQSKADTQDEMGGSVEPWADYETGVPCAVEYAGSREFPSSVKRVAESTIRFVFRYRSDIDPANMRIVYVDDVDASPVQEQIFDIFPAQHIGERRSFTAIEAKEAN